MGDMAVEDGGTGTDAGAGADISTSGSGRGGGTGFGFGFGSGGAMTGAGTSVGAGAGATAEDLDSWKREDEEGPEAISCLREVRLNPRIFKFKLRIIPLCTGDIDSYCSDIVI